MNKFIRNLILKVIKSVGLYSIFQKVIIFLFDKRPGLAKKYITGNGIEIGALNWPLRVSSKSAHVTYIDRLNNKGLRKHYPELNSVKLVKVGVVDNGENLKKIKNETQNFVIANHFIEHCEDPLTTFKNHLRVLKRGGVIFWAVPNKTYTFDHKRPLTPNNHLWLEYLKGTHFSRKKHYEEYVELALGFSGKKARKKVQELMASKYSIHYHVWTPDSFKKFLSFAKRKLHLKFNILEFSLNINEFIVILRKE